MTSIAQPPVAEAGAPRSVLFTVLAIALFGVSLFAAMAIVSQLENLLGLAHGLGLALWPIVWGGLGCAGVLLAGRIAFGRWLPVPVGGIGLAGLGLALAAIVNNLLYEWSVTRFGVLDSELVGWSAGLFATLVAIAVAGLALRVAPPPASVAARIALLAAAVATILIIASNVPGLTDGIAADSWPLALAVGAAGLYAVGVVGVAVRR